MSFRSPSSTRCPEITPRATGSMRPSPFMSHRPQGTKRPCGNGAMCPLASLRDALNAVTFHVKLGSVGDKTRRVRTLAGEIAAVGGKEVAETERAAELCKCDLLTAMVGEFPELQGIMGTYYALADGET